MPQVFDETRYSGEGGGAFGFTDYESGRRWGPDTDSHFGCNINLLLINFWIYYHLLMLLIDFIND